MKKGFLGIGIVLAIFLGVQSTSHALELGFNDFVNPIFIVADNSADDINPLAGVITYNGSIGGNWIVNVTTGVSKPVLGSAAAPWMDLNSVNITSSGGGHLRFGVKDIDFTGPITGGVAGPFAANVGGTVGPGGTASFDFYGDDNNQSGLPPFTFTDLFVSLGPFGVGAFSGTTSGSFNANSPFGLLIVADVTHTGAGVTSFDAELKVPEPISLTLLGFGLIGLIGYRRKKWFKK